VPSSFNFAFDFRWYELLSRLMLEVVKDLPADRRRRAGGGLVQAIPATGQPYEKLAVSYVAMWLVAIME